VDIDETLVYEGKVQLTVEQDSTSLGNLEIALLALPRPSRSGVEMEQTESAI
jgi:hypothetical protein